MAKASKDLSAYSVFDYELIQLSFNFLHPTPKDVQNNNYRVLETKLIDNLIYNTFFRNKANNTDKSYIHINDQLKSPYVLKCGYKLKCDYTTRTLRNFDPIKNYYIFQRKYASERPLIILLEALEPFKQYHTYHLEGSVTNRAFLNRVDFYTARTTTDLEKKIQKAVKASITDISNDNLTDMLADLLSKDDHFMSEHNRYKNRTNQSDQTDIL